jgi:hypothetical protein
MRAVLAGVTITLVFTLAAGCRRAPKTDRAIRATVTCAGATSEPVLDCEIEHLEGPRGANVCWKVEVDCPGNNRVSSQRLCQAVLPAATVRRSIALGDFGKCERVLKSQVSGLTVTPL